MQYYFTDSAVDLCTKIIRRMLICCPTIEPRIVLNEVTEHSGRVKLFLRENNVSFGTVHVEINEYEQNNLAFSVWAELDENEAFGTNIDTKISDYVITNYDSLYPCINCGIGSVRSKYNPKRTISKTFSVSMDIHDEQYTRNEIDATYDFNLDKISQDAITYVEAIVDIRNQISRKQDIMK